jgi:hypothetical protein
LLEYSNSSSTAACAFSTPTNYWTSTDTLAFGSIIYSNPGKSYGVGSGFYSDGTNWYDYTDPSQGIIDTGSCPTTTPGP